MTNANDMQIGGGHYKDAQPYQHWDFVEDMGCLPYMEAMVLKYLSRWRNKDGLKDLQKAGHFLQKLIELRRKKSPELWPIRTLNAEKAYEWCRVNHIGEDETQVIVTMCSWRRLVDLEMAWHVIATLTEKVQSAH